MKARSLPLVVAAAMFLATGTAGATEAPIAALEVSPPPPGSGVDVASIREVANAEIKQMDASQIPARRNVVVSLSLVRAALDGAFACTIHAMLRDARTGVMIAIIEAESRAEGTPSVELRRRVAHAAVRTAVRRIPHALGAK